MLQKIRKYTHFTRALTGMLLFVWLSVAISPCVMANSVMPNSVMTDINMTHHMTTKAFKMAMSMAGSIESNGMTQSSPSDPNCHYCPNQIQNKIQKDQLLHEHAHIVFDDANLTFDIPLEPAICLFEIPTSVLPLVTVKDIPSTPFLETSLLNSSLTPLEMTGILRL